MSWSKPVCQAKGRSLRGLANAIVEGRLDLDALNELDDEAVIETSPRRKG